MPSPEQHTILIVEDEPHIALVERKSLEAAGFAVEAVTNGAAALERLERHDVDLVLLDHQLPDMKGTDVVATLGERLKTLPVVIVTAHGDERLAVDMLKAGVADYVCKDARLGFVRELCKAARAAIDRFALEAENRILQAKLRKAHDELERKVAERTAQLAAANDQLRAEIAERKQMEEQLRKGRTFLQTVIDAIPDAFTVVDREGRIILANRAVREMAGDRDPVSSGMKCHELTHNRAQPCDDVADVCPLEKVIETKTSVVVEHRHHHDESAEHFVEITASPVLDEQGGVCQIIESCRDITQRRRAEEALRESERQYQALAEVSPVGIFRTDAEGGCLYVNERWCKMAGLTAEEAQGEGWARGLHPEDRERVFKEWYQASQGGLLFQSEYRFRNADGATTWVLGQARAEQDDSGEVTGHVGTITDITERRRAEEALKASEARLVEAQRIARLGSFSWDIVRNAAHWSDELYRIFGIEPQQLRATYEGFLERVHPDDRDRVNEHVEAALSQGKPYTVEHRIVLPDGTIRWMLSQGEVERDADGNAIRLSGTAQDITERKRAEAEREKLLHDLGERVKELTCVYGVASSIRKHGSLEAIFQDVVALLPPGWHYPEISRGKIRFDGKEYVSELFDETEWKQASNIIVGDERRGSVEVYYSQKCPVLDEGPFLKEERQLIDGIARALSEAIERKEAEEHLRRIEWLLTKGAHVESGQDPPWEQPYGDLVALNTSRLLADSVGPEVLTDIVGGYLTLLDTSAAVYERNGDYAFGLFSSGWCRFLDHASRDLCGTNDNRETLNCGKWHCHESCWSECSKVAVETGRPTDIECRGGIRLHAVPILAGGESVGSINFGYGDPPTDSQKLQEIAERYGVSADRLLEQAKVYESRPAFMIEIAKDRLKASARLIGEIVERKQAEEALRKAHDELETRVEERTAELTQANEILRREIAERKQAEEALRESDLWMRSIFSSLDEAVLVVTPDRRIANVNAAAERTFGYSKDELAGLSTEILHVDHEHYLKFGKRIQEAFDHGQTAHFEFEARRKNGDVFPSEHTVSLLKNEAGKAVGIVSVIMDITGRKRSQDALRESEERFHAIADFTYDWETWVDSDGKVLWINPAVERITGYTVEECLATPDYPMYMIHEDDRAKTTAAFRDTACSCTSGNDVTFRIRCKDGTMRWGAVSWQPIFNTGGVCLGIRSSVRDITERKRAEEQAQKHLAELAHVARVGMIVEMGAGIAHEINQPLTAIVNYAESCADLVRSGTADPDELCESLDKVSAQAVRAGQIIRRLRRLVRKGDAVRSTTDINDLLRETAALLGAETRLIGAAVRLELSDDVSVLLCDSVQIQQVILNLIQNALDAMSAVARDARHLDIRSRLTADGAVEIAVSDTGPGFPEGVGEKVFDAFFTTKEKGLGMGLSISRSILEDHGGRLWVTPNADRGVTFRMRLPLSKREGER